MSQEVDYAKYLAEQAAINNATPTATNMSFPVENAQQFNPDQIVSDMPLAPLTPTNMNDGLGPMDMMGQGGHNLATSAVDTAWNSQQDQRTPTEEPSFFDNIGSGISDFFGDEERMARMTIALNSMRLNPDPNIAKSMENKIESLRKHKGANKTVIAIQQLMNNPNITESEKYRLGAILKGVQDGVLTPSDAYTQALKRDTKGMTIDLGNNQAMYDAVGKDLVERKGSWRVASVANKNLFEQYNRLDNLLANIGETGLDEEFKQNLRTTFGGLPILSGFIDQVKLGQGQELRAVLNKLVLEELRLNKGPQTDFDAIFAGTTLPNLGNTTEANTALVTYGKGASRLQTLMGEIVSEAKYSNPDQAVSIMNVVDRIQASAPGVIYRTDPTTKVTKQTYFEDWYNAPNQKSLTAYERLVEWTNIKRQMDGLTLINLDILKTK